MFWFNEPCNRIKEVVYERRRSSAALSESEVQHGGTCSSGAASRLRRQSQSRTDLGVMSTHRWWWRALMQTYRWHLDKPYQSTHFLFPLGHKKQSDWGGHSVNWNNNVSHHVFQPFAFLSTVSARSYHLWSGTNPPKTTPDIALCSLKSQSGQKGTLGHSKWLLEASTQAELQKPVQQSVWSSSKIFCQAAIQHRVPWSAKFSSQPKRTDTDFTVYNNFIAQRTSF